MKADRYRLVREDSGGELYADRRGRVQEWASPMKAVRALKEVGADLDEWRLFWLPAGCIGWREDWLASEVAEL